MRIVCLRRSPGGDLGAKKKKKKQKRKKEKPSSGGAKSDSASDSQEMKVMLTEHKPLVDLYSSGAQTPVFKLCPYFPICRTRVSPCRSSKTFRGPWSCCPARVQPRASTRQPNTSTSFGTHSLYPNSVGWTKRGDGDRGTRHG